MRDFFWILNTLPFRGSGAVPAILFDEKYCINIFLNFERPIILTTDSRNKKALPEYPHRGYSGSAFITTNAMVGGACRHSGCVNNAAYLVMVKPPAFHFLSSPNSSCCRSTSLRRLAFSTLRRCSSRILTDDWRETSRAWPVVWGIEAASEAS